MTDNKYERLWARALCFYLWDAIKGPMHNKPSGLEHKEEYESRKVSRDHVLSLHPDFLETCQNAGLGAAHVFRDWLISGRLTADVVDRIWRNNGGD